MTQRAGFSTVELITTLTLLALVSVACALAVQSQSRVLRHESERAVGMETLRTGRVILRGDLGSAAVADIRSVVADSAALRAFRGWAIVCAHSSSRAALRYRGLRAPDPNKDSLLLIASERVSAFRQSSSTTLSCALQSDEQLVIIEPDVQLTDGAVALFFESGIYHLSTAALRYHRPGESRQPLTDQLIDTRQSRFMLDRDSGGIRIQLRSSGQAVPDALGDTHVRFTQTP